MPGAFITFEGGEGAGKTTLIQSLAAHFTHDAELVVTREPGGTPASEVIRQLLVTGDADRWDAVSETALFLTARRAHVEQLIRPSIAEGKIVLCDRFMDSTLVYQGIVKKLGVDYVKRLEALIVGTTVPDLTLLVDVPAEIGLARSKALGGNEQRFEGLGLPFHQHIRQAFLDIAQTEKQRIKVINGTHSQQDVFDEALAHITALLNG